jgi:hypothetical protein
MTATERLIDEIMAASQIPSAKRRREVLRELQAHVEDFVSAGRQTGRGEEDVERLLLEGFGDPRQIARQFASVYRRERAALHLGGFLISTVVVSLVISAAAISMQAGIMFGLTDPARIVFGSRHTAVVALDILASAAAYLALLSLGRFFERPLAVLAVIAAVLLTVFVAVGLPPQFILFGFANGALLRGIQVSVRHPALQFGAALACFALLGVVFFHPSSSAIVATAMSWLIMGSAYHLMTHVAARVDRALLRKL